MKKILLATLIMTLTATMTISAEENTKQVKAVLYSEESTEVALPVLYTEENTDVLEAVLYTEETSDEVIIPQPELIMDQGVVTTLAGDRNAKFIDCSVAIGESDINYDVESTVVDGVVYLPLRYTLEALGYEVVWNGENQSVDIIKGGKFTSIYIGKNSYFKNKMAPAPLSGAPFVTEGRTLIPLEFFYTILDESFIIDSNRVVFNNDMMAIHSGYVQTIEYDETGGSKITISSKEISEDMMDLTIIHANSNFTVFQKDVVESVLINVLSAPVMTMSIPGQTAGYVIY